MGFLTDLGVTVGDLGARKQARDDQTKQLLLSLVTANPGLMRDPGISSQVGGAFQQNPGVGDILSQLKGVQLAEEARQRGVAEDTAETDYARGLGSIAAQLGADIEGKSADEIEAVIAERQRFLHNQKTLSERTKQETTTEEGALNRASRELIARMGRDATIGAARAQITAARFGAGLPETPEYTPAATKASQARVELVLQQQGIQEGNLVNVIELDRIIREDGGESPGVERLWQYLQQAPDAFVELFGPQWEIAQEDAARLPEDLTNRYLLRPDARSVREEIAQGVDAELAEISKERNAPVLDPTRVGAAEAFSQYPLTGEWPEVGGGPEHENPRLSLETMPSEVASMYLQAQDNQPLQEAYRNIIGMSPGDWNVAFESMQFFRERYEYYSEQVQPTPQLGVE